VGGVYGEGETMKHVLKKYGWVVLSALVTAAAALPMFSQQQAPARPSFEVASIKPNSSGDNRIMIMNQPGGRFVATGVTLKLLMTSAYRVRDFQIIGGPGWIATDRWDIEARAAEGAIPPGAFPTDPNFPSLMSLMTQSLLEDRFHLKLHRETRELAVYELTIAKGGSKVKRSEDQTPFKLPGRGAPPLPPPQRGGPMPRGSMRVGRGDLLATAVPFSNFAMALSQQLGRTVVNKTGLTGLYDIHLQWTPDFAVPPGFPWPKHCIIPRVRHWTMDPGRLKILSSQI
jgi:uncharacterized protein (TIGR03435 family)